MAADFLEGICMIVRFGAAVAAAMLLLGAQAIAAAPRSAIDKAVADPARPKADRDADARRKPAETLAFSGVKPGDKVGEFLPGGGYYTRLLSDVVGPRGTVYALETTRWGKENVDATKAVLSEPGRSNVRFDASPFGEFNLADKVDVFWTTLNYHDLHIAKYGAVDMAKFNRHVHDVLKPGGVYVIVDHAANPGTADAAIANLHRIDKAVVIKEVTAAGFTLADESDALHRPADDHTKTVFDKAVQGHTDQFMLKFRRI
jgi:predicted methyltransferase